MPDPIVSVPAIVLAAVPIGGMADVVGRFFTNERGDGVQGLPFDFSIVFELMAAATCAFDEDDSSAAAA